MTTEHMAISALMQQEDTSKELKNKESIFGLPEITWLLLGTHQAVKSYADQDTEKLRAEDMTESKPNSKEVSRDNAASTFHREHCSI
ncbi:hypothetical protein CB1_079655002 [Camelus ferus]|nr:hypothetical protein CB1_079655002 [Camelus ferus]